MENQPNQPQPPQQPMNQEPGFNQPQKPKSTRLYFLIAIIVLVLIGAFYGIFWIITRCNDGWFTLSRCGISDSNVADWQIYRNEKYGFEFKYTSGFKANDGDVVSEAGAAYISTCEFESVACLAFIGQEYEGTNFEGAGFGVKQIANSKNNEQCAVYLYGSDYSKLLKQEKLINGIKFYYGESGGVGAGHSSADYIYHAFQKNTCWEIILRISETNYRNYEPGVIKEFTTTNSKNLLTVLNQILSTFRFIE